MASNHMGLYQARDLVRTKVVFGELVLLVTWFVTFQVGTRLAKTSPRQGRFQIIAITSYAGYDLIACIRRRPSTPQQLTNGQYRCHIG